ncbi:MAG: LEA type 2 family protein [Methanoregulaceae archaeon]|nr:LEA type 2 family protein [Methanoregulaceae archaeon]
MPILQEPAVTLEGIRVRAISLASMDLDVLIRLNNPNPIGVTLRELRFVTLCGTGGHEQKIADGNTGSISIPARDSTVFTVPVTSHNKALIRAMAAFVARGGIHVTIKGVAVIDCIVACWSLPFTKSFVVTARQLAGALTGQKHEK